MRSTLSLPLLPGPLWPGVVAPDRARLLYSRNTTTYTNISWNIIKHKIRTSMNERTHFFIKNISLTLYSRKGWCWLCVRDELETGIDGYADPQYFFLILAGLLNRGSLRAQSPLSAAGSQFGILSPTDSDWLEPLRAPGYIIVSRPPASAVLPLIYTGASLDWWLGRGSIRYTIYGLDRTNGIFMLNWIVWLNCIAWNRNFFSQLNCTYI